MMQSLKNTSRGLFLLGCLAAAFMCNQAVERLTCGGGLTLASSQVLTQLPLIIWMERNRIKKRKKKMVGETVYVTVTKKADST